MAKTRARKKKSPRDNQLGLEFAKGARSAKRKHAPNKSGSAKTTAPARTRKQKSKRATAESMAAAQREISISEFFAKNRHLLGFDNKRKALLTAVKEAVDNGLDACEEAHILPEIHVLIKQLDEDRFRIIVRDNGPGIVKQQIPNIFGKLLYGSKFHRLRMSRGQQGIGISAAGLYGLLTTGKPVHITSKLPRKSDAHHYQIQIDTKKNRPEVVKDETVNVDWQHGTEVQIDLLASYMKGRQSVDEYMFQTAIANPHACFTYKSPTHPTVEYPRSVDELPNIPDEIKPHPHGVELGMMIKMMDDTSHKHLGGFLQGEFSRVSPRVSGTVCKAAGLTPRTYVRSMDGAAIERVYNLLQKTKLMAPPIHCLEPIGPEQLLSGLLQGVKSEFYTASTRPPTVYRGNPFQIEIGLAYGGQLGPGRNELQEDDKKRPDPQARVIRFANRVPLLYQQSACCMYRSVIDTKWNNYGIPQARGALPGAPLLIMVHMASVWVPFTSEAKEAIANYDEISKEIRLAIQECGRRLGTLLKRKKKRQAYVRRRDVFTRYIDELVNATRAIKRINKESFKSDLIKLARQYTLAADMEFDEHGKVVRRAHRDTEALQHTVVVEQEDQSAGVAANLFGDEEPRKSKVRKRVLAPKNKHQKKKKKKMRRKKR